MSKTNINKNVNTGVTINHNNITITFDDNGIYSTDYFTPINDNAFVQKKYVDDKTQPEYSWLGTHISTGSTDEFVIHQFNTDISNNSVYELVFFGTILGIATQVAGYKVYMNQIDDFSTATEITYFRLNPSPSYNGQPIYFSKKMIIIDNVLHIQNNFPGDTTPAISSIFTADSIGTSLVANNRKILSEISVDTNEKLYIYITNTLQSTGLQTRMKMVNFRKFS